MTRSERFRLYLLKGIAALLRPLGFDILTAMGRGLGRLIWHLVPERRAIAAASIEKHLQVDRAEAERIGKESFQHTGAAFAEILLTGRFGMDSPRLRLEDASAMEQLRQCSRPIVAATAHFGSWELLASLLGQLYEEPRPRMVVVRRYPDPAVQNFIASCREATGATMVGHRQAAMAVIRALHKKGIVAFLVDHNALPNEALRLPFLGEEACVNMGPALLALRAKALIWPVVLLRDGKDYVFCQRPPLDTAELHGTMEENIRTATEFYTAAVESIIREHPEQWFWMHNRWKARR